MSTLAISRWFRQRTVEARAALIFGALAITVYVLLFLSHSEGQGIWMMLFFFSFPIAWPLNFVTSLLTHYLPEPVGGFLYSIQVIVAGILWVYVLGRFLKWILTRRRRDKS